ncbi:hypothetical protein BGZ81_007208 [Podila clonocystis]|nr:hypothetical protein BGZ81_007208 [Podila clonocystis]
MYKTLFLILAVCSTVVLGVESNYFLHLKNSAGKEQTLVARWGTRQCVCLKNTQTASIRGQSGGVIKLFSTNDCTGNYQTLGSDKTANNAQWVNSASWGKGGISSSNPNGCPNFFA